MYLKNVNRGISFTKAGTYTTGLVLVLGFLATSSGSNAFFIALGFGLSLLVISGLLSERSMKYSRISGVGNVVADAGAPFSLPLQITNDSQSWFLFGVETLGLVTLPPFKLFNAKIMAQMESRLLALGPGETKQVQARASGMQRGHFESLYLIQRTLFPFGLISKFKVVKARTNLSILPKLDVEYLEKMVRELSQVMAGALREEEFHSHRNYLAGDSPHSIDWKKNAGKPQADWVVKVNRSSGESESVLVRPDWNFFNASSTEVEYERFLSKVRTVLEAVIRVGKKPILQLPVGFLVAQECLWVLAQAPKHADLGRGWGPVPSTNSISTNILVLEVGTQSHHFREAS
jgi:hypothetical protein